MAKLGIKNILLMAKKAAMIWLGLCLIAFGFIAGFIPFLPGFLFAFLGLVLIAKASSHVRNYHPVKQLFSFLRKKIEDSEDKRFHKLLILF